MCKEFAQRFLQTFFPITLSSLSSIPNLCKTKREGLEREEKVHAKAAKVIALPFDFLKEDPDPNQRRSCEWASTLVALWIQFRTGSIWVLVEAGYMRGSNKNPDHPLDRPDWKLKKEVIQVGIFLLLNFMFHILFNLISMLEKILT